MEQGPSTSQDRASERVQQGEEDRRRESEWQLEVVRGIPAYTPSPPLFTPEQLSALEASQIRAQHIYRTPEAMNLKRPAFLQDELPGGHVQKEEQEDQEGKKVEDLRAEPAVPEVFRMNGGAKAARGRGAHVEVENGKRSSRCTSSSSSSKRRK